MAEFNLANELQSALQPQQTYESSMKTMGNMETDRVKHEELKALFQELISFKNAKDSGKIPQDYAPSQEVLQQLHQETAPHLSEDEFAKVAETFKVGIGGSNAPQSSPDAPQSIPSQDQGNGAFKESVPSGSNMGDVLLAALASMGRAPSSFDIGGQMAEAIKSKQMMGLKKQEMASSEKERAMQLAAAKAAAESNNLVQVKVVGPDGKPTIEWVKKGQRPTGALYEKDANDQFKAVTEKGGNPVIFDGKKLVVQDGDKQVTYNPKVHGKMMSPTLSQTSVFVHNNPTNKTPTPRELIKDAATMRKEFNARPEIKEYNLIQPKIVSMEKALAESKRTGKFIATDQALITLFNKLTDPSSVVRESEYARMAVNMPLVNAIAGKAYKVLNGGAGLTSAERTQIVDMAKLMKQAYQDVFDLTATEYEGYAKDSGLNPELVIGKTRRTPKISSDAEYEKLPSGTSFIAPDGTRRVKP